MIRALSFDLDGTLVDTAGEIAEAVNLTLGEFAIAPRPQVEITGLIGNGLRELMMRPDGAHPARTTCTGRPCATRPGVDPRG